MAEQKKRESQESKENRGFVRYIGASDTRIISREDFEGVGINHETLVWDKNNQWTVRRSDVSDEAYERAIQPDMELVLVDSEGARLPS